jgi:ubiquinone/menaquinone biosynthesis C-methylase UbiE
VGVCGWLFAAVYDRLCAPSEAAGLRARRQHLLHRASGRVLEVGAGTGANLALYPRAIASLTLVEPEAAMARRLATRVRAQRASASIVTAAAERLPFDAARFDTVVSTLVLCTVADQAQALRELRRVLTPGGRLLFLEHVRSDEPRVAAWQDRLNGINRIVAQGCNCNRSTADAIRAAGFDIEMIDRGELPKAPAFLRPLIVGSAISS